MHGCTYICGIYYIIVNYFSSLMSLFCFRSGKAVECLAQCPKLRSEKSIMASYEAMNKCVVKSFPLNEQACGRSYRCLTQSLRAAFPAHGPDFSLPVPALLKGFLWPPEPLCPCV